MKTKLTPIRTLREKEPDVANIQKYEDQMAMAEKMRQWTNGLRDHNDLMNLIYVMKLNTPSPDKEKTLNIRIAPMTTRKGEKEKEQSKDNDWGPVPEESLGTAALSDSEHLFPEQSEEQDTERERRSCMGKRKSRARERCIE